MSLKTRFLCGLFAVSPMSSVMAETHDDSFENKDSTELTIDTLSNPENINDSVSADTIVLEEAVNQDSLVSLKKEANFAKAEELMFYLIANFEGFRSIPYKLREESFLTYNFGNTTTAEGTAVQPTDTIKTAEEAFDCYNAYLYTPTEKHPVPLKEAMINALPIDKMEDFEIAVMGEIGYNHGPGLFWRNGKPTRFAKLASVYFETRTPESFDSFIQSYLAHNTAKGKIHPVLNERRKIGAAILKKEIMICVDDRFMSELSEECQGKTVNMKKQKLGMFYGTGGNPEVIMRRTNEEAFNCPIDSIQYAINKDLERHAAKISRSAQTPAQKRTLADVRRSNGR